MNKERCVGDYFYTDDSSLKHMHELEKQKGNPFVAGSMAGSSYAQLPLYGGLSHATYGWPHCKTKEPNCSKNVVKGESEL